MPSRFNLSYGVTSILIKSIKDAFQKDHDLHHTEGANRINVPQVLDGWNYTMREFPTIVVTQTPGNNRRMGIGDFAPLPYFGVGGTEDQVVSTQTHRKFAVSSVLPVGTVVHAEYNADGSGDPIPTPDRWDVAVKESSPGVRYIELNGSDIGPYTAYPAENLAFTSETSTAEQYGGFFDLKADIYIVSMSQTDREIVTDKLWSFLWFTKKRELLVNGVVILDVSYSGNTQEDFGADKLYISRMTVSCATEFRQLVYYLDAVESIRIEGTVIELSTL